MLLLRGLLFVSSMRSVRSHVYTRLRLALEGATDQLRQTLNASTLAATSGGDLRVEGIRQRRCAWSSSQLAARGVGVHGAEHRGPAAGERRYIVYRLAKVVRRLARGAGAGRAIIGD